MNNRITASLRGGNQQRYKKTMNNMTLLGTGMLGMNTKRPNPQTKPFDPKDYMNVGLDEREVMIYKEIFDLFDVNKNGFLIPKELYEGLRLSGLNLDLVFTYTILGSCNIKDLSRIHFHQFLKLCTDTRPCDNDDKDKINKYFYNFLLSIVMKILLCNSTFYLFFI